MYRYDTGERPPAAIVTVKVTDPVTGNQASLPGKLDTGAAISVLPIATVAELGLSPRSLSWACRRRATCGSRDTMRSSSNSPPIS
jgi:hypothetical protein